VSIFLTETDTRHSLLHKRKLFRDKIQTRLTSNSSKLMGASHDEPIDVEGQFPQREGDDDVPIIREEDGDDQNAINLADIPMADETAADLEPTNRRPKRRRSRGQGQEAERGSEDGSDAEVVIDDSDSSADDELFVGEGESDESDAVTGPRPPKRRKEKAAAEGDTTAAAAAARDDKKKMAMDISYEGFAIYGRVLCLVVKRRGDGAAKSSGSAVTARAAKDQTGRPGGQAMMENWIASTQLPETVGEGDALRG
jgi:hypothetical protein